MAKRNPVLEFEQLVKCEPEEKFLARVKRVAKRSLEVRFFMKVCHEPNTGCWLWMGHVDPEGYARVREAGRGSTILYGHRISYELAKGPIPAEMDLDHLCRVRSCVNPDHLEAVPHRVNFLRGSHPLAQIHRTERCKRGHERNEANTYYRQDRPGRWNCLACRRERRAAARGDRERVSAAD